MTTTAPSTDVAVVDPTLSDAERYALAAFLAGYRGLTRDADAPGRGRRGLHADAPASCGSGDGDYTLQDQADRAGRERPRDARAGRVVFRRGPEYVDDESGELALEQLNAADTLLTGRNTYEIDAGAWPDRHGALSDQ